MKNKWKKIICMLCCLILCIPTAMPVMATEASGENEEVNENIIEINDEEAFLEFAENCKLDSFSSDKIVSLNTDINLSGKDFCGIPYFNGTFEGNNHTINNLNITEKGSDIGLFRYVGPEGLVKNLIISGNVMPEGSKCNVGGVVGVNEGFLLNCRFNGKVSGEECVGAVVGINRETGVINFCKSNATVLATNQTGGISGYNEGLISNCSSESAINTEELDTSVDVGGVDIGALNFTQSVTTRNNMGGIAGSSVGIIQKCTNNGTVGFLHTGYNVGGIVGIQSGIVSDCLNRGEVLGRKDIGGIVGQAEPYIESEYLDEKVEETRKDIDYLQSTANRITKTVNDTIENAADYSKEMADERNVSEESIKDDFSNLQNDIKNGTLNTEEKTEEEVRAEIEASVNSEENKKDVEGLIDIMEQGTKEVNDGINSIVNQLNHIANNTYDSLGVLTGEEEFIEDISSIELADDIDGVITLSKNYGAVKGDINVGGIAGCMNIEYDNDPEVDMDMTESMDVVLRSTVNDVVLNCMNYGVITVKKNHAGTIVGTQELGIVYACEGYGRIDAEEGDYIGGVVGESNATIQKCYSLCSIVGNDYVGGICGKGETVTDSISCSTITSDGESVGNILGNISTAGTIANNIFSDENHEGIDGVSYAEKAEWKAYEAIMELEDIPKGFQKVTITYFVDGEKQSEQKIAYGSNISEEDFPTIKNKDGYYVVWNTNGNLENICEHRNIEAEYIAWTESVSGDIINEDGKSIFIAEADFYENDRIEMQEIENPKIQEEKASVLYAYEWKIVSEQENALETVEGHFYVPSDCKNAQVWLHMEDSWQKADYIEDGSYLLATIPYGAEFALVEVPRNLTIYMIIGGVMLCVVVFGMIYLRIRKKRKKNCKKSVK